MLLEQPFVKDPKITIGKLVEGLGGDATRPPVRPRQGRARSSVRSHEREREPMARAFRRVVLKLSGEAFADTTTGFGIDAAVVQRIAEEVAEARAELGVEIAVVVGGGNIFRGMSGATRGMDRARADYMGMLATVINALALQDALEAVGQPTRVQTAITMAQVAEPFIPLRAIRHLEKGRVVVFAAGHRQPVLHHRHHRRAARRRDRRRGDPEGHALRASTASTAPTPASTPTAVKLDRGQPLRGAEPGPQGDGLDRDHVLHGQRAADHRVRRDRARQHPPRARRRARSARS